MLISNKKKFDFKTDQLKKRIIIRADGGSKIGMGHVIRCLALAEMLKEHFHISFAIQDPSDSVRQVISLTCNDIITLPSEEDFKEDLLNFLQHITKDDIVVLDGYEFKSAYQNKIKERSAKLVFIDDLHNWHQYADVIINHADGISSDMYSAEPYTRFFLGLNYALLRPEFFTPDQSVRNLLNIDKVFISMGAADIENNTIKFIKALTQIEKVKEIHLMLSSVNSRLKDLLDFIETNSKQNISTHFNISAKEVKDLLNKCNLAICPASGISLECCAIGIPLVSGYTAENQKGNLSGLEKHKTIINIASINDLSIEEIVIKFTELINNPSIFDKLLQNQRHMIDGKSPLRILSIFKELSKF
jgi:UDP-2,4-diacetamido-2,4,6-trideoxy-beta-L-altropyranose hydrolase